LPQVPYSPVSNVEPIVRPETPPLRDLAPSEAFGLNIAAGVSKLGASVSQGSTEIFNRAFELQQLQNETDARQADTNYMMEAGNLHAKYDALQGPERVAAFPKYSQDLQDSRLKFRNTLANPMAQRMYDTNSLSTMGRSIFNGAGAAAAAQRDSALGAANAQYDLTTKNVYNNPDDEAQYRDALSRSDSTAQLRAASTPGGATPERVAYIQQQGRSELTYNRIVGMARNNPDQAYKLLDGYEKEGLIFGKEDIAARAKVEGMIQTVGMNTVANQVLTKYLQADGTYSKSSQEMQGEAVAIATKAYPDMPAIATAAQGAFDRNFNQHSWGLMQDQRQRQQEIYGYQVKGAMTTDMLPPDLVKRMTPAEIKAYPGQANTYQHSIDTQTNIQDYRKYLGMYNDNNSAFMDINFNSVPGLSQENRKTFLGMQRQAQANGDPRVWKAMRQLEGSHGQVLNDLSVTGTGKDPQTANQFVGALHDAIQSYQESNGKPPDEKTISEQIFPAVTRQVATPGWLFGTNQTPFFRAAVPDEYAEKFKGLKPDATDDEIHRAYSQQIFDQFFKGQKATKDQGRVGQ
jgi:hypothetical protein